MSSETTMIDEPRLILEFSEFGSKDLRSVGNYNVGRLIGKGSFGKVYLASHRLTNGSKVNIATTYGCALILRDSSRLYSNLQRKMIKTSREKYIIIANLYIHILRDYMK